MTVSFNAILQFASQLPPPDTEPDTGDLRAVLPDRREHVHVSANRLGRQNVPVQADTGQFSRSLQSSPGCVGINPFTRAILADLVFRSSRAITSMINFQRLGGAAAILAAGTYLIGFWFYFTVLEPARYGSGQIDPTQHVLFLVEHQSVMHAWNLIIYVANAFLLVILAVALHQRIKSGCAGLAQTATGFGLIWAGLLLASGMLANVALGRVIDLHHANSPLTATIWQVLATVEEGLGGGNEIAGGLWILLVSWAGQWSKSLPTGLNALGGVIGTAGLLTVVPALGEAGSVFGLGFIVWFIWVGGVLMFSRSHQSRSVQA